MSMFIKEGSHSLPCWRMSHVFADSVLLSLEVLDITRSCSQNPNLTGQPSNPIGHKYTI